MNSGLHSAVLALCCLVTGHVQATSGAPLDGAAVTLDGSRTYRTATGAAGTFVLTVRPGRYRLTARAPGFAALSVPVNANHDVQVAVALEPLDAPTLRIIGHVEVDGRLTPLASAIPSVSITRPEMERLGEERVADALELVPSATFSRPDGGPQSAVSVVSLRGPDPSESLVTLDGQVLNDGNTGDLDLSRFPVAAFSAIDVTEGLGPTDLNGSNTFGGAVNLVSLRPTQTAQQSLSLSAGSFGTTEAWYNATGTHRRLSYAFAADQQNQHGFVDRTVPLFSTIDPACSPCATHLGSAIASRFALANLAWSFSQRADVTARLFLLGDRRDQSSAQNGIDRNAADAGLPQYGDFIGPGAQTFAQTVRAYQLRARAPLGAGDLIADISDSDNSVDVAGGTASPYDVTHADRRDRGGLWWQRTFERTQFAVGGYTQYESLQFGAPLPRLGQTIDVAFLRGSIATHKLHLDAGGFASRYTSFGTNLDGRLGAIYLADPTTSLRFSVGTGFRAPLLIERYRFPYSELTLDANKVFVGQGNPYERPEHATEYELGASHEFARRATFDAALYRTNLRDPIEVFYPFAAVAAGRCVKNSATKPLPECVSYTSNTGNAVYQGAELRLLDRIVPAHLFATIAYGLNVAYPRNLSAAFSNPTSGGNLVNDAQFLGIPQQQASLEFDWTNEGWHSAASAVWRGNNNELHQGPFTMVNGLVGRQFGPHLDVSVAVTNLTNAVAGPFTLFGGGVPYRGIVAETPAGAPVYGPLPTNALFVEPFALRLIATARQ
ncbi:MAG: TonB-dependent receptor [Candidatus Eremiobacteraeota bacterium]|nr:TonB-dependent receptor [Candidatus Eremiobacteraeota bacterium]